MTVHPQLVAAREHPRVHRGDERGQAQPLRVQYPVAEQLAHRRRRKGEEDQVLVRVRVRVSLSDPNLDPDPNPNLDPDPNPDPDPDPDLAAAGAVMRGTDQVWVVGTRERAGERSRREHLRRCRVRVRVRVS